MKSILFASLLFFSAIAFSKDFSVIDRIKTNRAYLNTYPLLFPDNLVEDDRVFVESLKKKANYESEILPLLKLCDQNLPKIYLKPLIHWRFVEANRENFEKVLVFALFHKVLILRDNVDSPYTQNPKLALALLQKVTGHASIKTDSLYTIYFPLIQEKVHLMSSMKEEKLFLEALKATRLFTFSFRQHPEITPYILSYYGFIPGNEVDLISKNDTNRERMKWVQKIEKKSVQQDRFSLKQNKMPDSFYSKGNPLFKKDPIFIKLREMISKAKESVFIDTMYFEGTIGTTIGNFLLKKTREKGKKNPNFRTLLIHRNQKINPVIKHLKSVISNDPLLRNNFTVLTTPLKNKYTDRSRIIIVDGNTSKPSAYFGSKNLADKNGAFFFDDSFYIQGPAAAISMDAYRQDIFKALSDSDGLAKETRESILKTYTKVKDHIVMKGKGVVRLCQSSSDSKIVNVKQQIVDMITKAKKTIFMEQQFFYDKNIVDSLIKKKVEVPELQVKLLLDPNQDLNLGGLPNTIFLNELVNAGIEIRTRSMTSLKDSLDNPYYSINHRKIISVDGRVVLGGSSNITPNSLKGQSREFGAQVFDREIAQHFERKFLKDWNDPKRVLILDIENFEARLDGKKLNKEDSHLINKILSLLLRSKDKLLGL